MSGKESKKCFQDIQVTLLWKSGQSEALFLMDEDAVVVNKSELAWREDFCISEHQECIVAEHLKPNHRILFPNAKNRAKLSI